MNGDWFYLTDHAALRLRQRKIQIDWVEQTLERPDRTEPDPIDPQLKRALRCIHAANDRVLRVVYNDSVAPIRVITVLFES